MIASRPLRQWISRLLFPNTSMRRKYDHFKALLRADAQALDLIADLDSHLYGYDPADSHRIQAHLHELMTAVQTMISELTEMKAEYAVLQPIWQRICTDINGLLRASPVDWAPPYVIGLDAAADYPHLAGGKACNLSSARRFGAQTPYGFVVTSSAFFRFMRENNLEQDVKTLFKNVSISNYTEIIRVTGEMQERILACDIPEDIVLSIKKAIVSLGHHGKFAVRSSALSEDGKISFAGQYASELNVDSYDIFGAYKRVLAGKYCPRAVSYRIRHGLTDNDTAMAVLVLPMIPATISGVVYTCDPACPMVGGKAIGVYVVSGLADSLVDGSSTPGKYYLTREDKPRLLSGCGIVSSHHLPQKELEALGSVCMLLERGFGVELDVEWAYAAGDLFVLQARPLQQSSDPAARLPDESEDAEILLSGLECASPGTACGSVFYADQGIDFRNISPGSVVVTRTLKPALSQFLDHIAAIVAENGSRASHLASVARERGVPVVVGMGGSTLQFGAVVTVDAAGGAVYSGCLPSVLDQSMANKDARALIRSEHAGIVSLSVRLNLVDPSVVEFAPCGCRSLHDLVRFCHEKSVMEMFSLVDRAGRGMSGARRIATDLPLVMYLLDLGGGLLPRAPSSGDVSVEWLSSGPLKSLWAGLADNRIFWDRTQLHVDWEDFDRISGGIFRIDSAILASYAVISNDYLHLNIRFGYHFSVIDSVCGNLSSANYIKFKFKGGGASIEQRALRLLFIQNILNKIGFEIRANGDLLDGTLLRLSANKTKEGLFVLGLILAYTRLLDVKLYDRDAVVHETGIFLNTFVPGVIR